MSCRFFLANRKVPTIRRKALLLQREVSCHAMHSVQFVKVPPSLPSYKQGNINVDCFLHLNSTLPDAKLYVTYFGLSRQDKGCSTPPHFFCVGLIVVSAIVLLLDFLVLICCR